MPERGRSHGTSLHQRLTRWESVLVMVLLIDTLEERFLFPAAGIPGWAKVGIKMAIVVGVLGAFLHFVNRRIDGGLSVTRSIGGSSFLPRYGMHLLLLASIFAGFYWLKLHRFPWE